MKLGFMSVILKQNLILHNGSQKHHPDPKKSLAGLFQCKKRELTVFYDCEDVIHHALVSCGQTVNKEFYLKVVKRFREAMRRKRPDFLRGVWGWLLRHCNASVHSPI
jgi:hypothetical protein